MPQTRALGHQSSPARRLRATVFVFPDPHALTCQPTLLHAAQIWLFLGHKVLTECPLGDKPNLVYAPRMAGCPFKAHLRPDACNPPATRAVPFTRLCRQIASPLSTGLIAIATLTAPTLLTSQPTLAIARTPPADTSSQVLAAPQAAPSAISLLKVLRHHLDTDPAKAVAAESLPASQGLCVIIRTPRDLGGELLAVVSAMTPESPASQSLSASVINRALDRARTRLTTRLSSLSADRPASDDASVTDRTASKAAELLRLCTITVEVVGDIAPLTVERLESLDLRLLPLAQGFAVTIQTPAASPQTAAVFQTEMMLAGLTPAAAAGRALAEATGNPQAPLKPLTDLNPAPTFFTFQSTQATELPGNLPQEMRFGQIPLPQATIDSAEEISALITSLTQGLQTLVLQQPGPLPEDVDLASGRVTTADDPHRAAAADALVLLALHRAARTLTLDPQSMIAKDLAAAKATLTARVELYLLDHAATSQLSTQPASPAAFLPAAIYLLTDGGTPETRKVAISILAPLASQFQPASRAPDAPQRVLAATDGLLLSALLRASLISPQIASTTLTDSPPSLIRTAPWSFWLLLGPAKETLDPQTRQTLTAAREAIVRLQARFLTDTSNPSDLGGMLLPLRLSPRLDAQIAPADQPSPLRAPTWRTLSLTAALPSFALDQDLVPASSRGELLVSSLSTMRYLRQLQVDPATAWYAQDPERYQGLVRLATWETRVSTDATSLALLAACDTLAAVRHITAVSRQPATAPTQP